MVTWNNKGRFHIIHKYKHHIKVYAIVGTVGIIWSLFHLPFQYIIYLIFPFIISAGYVIPLRSEYRLRDINYIKIFLIALVWAYISILPIILTDGLSATLLSYLIEKFLFLLAITIPFDIRDKTIDSRNNLRTIPDLLGVRKSYLLSITLLLLCAIIHLQLFSGQIAIALVISDLLIISMIFLSKKVESDYMYSGVLDGSFLLRLLLLCSISGISLIEIWS